MTSRVKLKSTGTLLLVDFLSMYYRGSFVHRGLEHEGVPTGGLFGIVQQLSNAIEKIKPDKVIFCTDSKPYFRAMEYPSYKLDREKKSDEEIKQLILEQSMCRNFVIHLGVPFVQRKGLEADDLIALIIKNQHKDYGRIVIASGDSDLYQLFTYDNVELYRGAQKGFYTIKDFKEEFPELDSPSQWNEVLAYSGGHNGLNGIKGIGIKTGIKIVTGAALSKKVREDLQSSKKQVALNIKLGALPFYKVHNRVISVPPVPEYNERALIRFLARYGIALSFSMSESFSSIHNS